MGMVYIPVFPPYWNASKKREKGGRVEGGKRKGRRRWVSTRPVISPILPPKWDAGRGRGGEKEGCSSYTAFISDQKGRGSEGKEGEEKKGGNHLISSVRSVRRKGGEGGREGKRGR